jgi:hypothetical protein
MAGQAAYLLGVSPKWGGLRDRRRGGYGGEMRLPTRSRIVQTLFAAACLVVLALALPSSSSAQATRTWVSGVGDDANPCSRTAPCKTFAGAISKTAARGEINCLDAGGFGGVTITKSISIDCQGSWHAGVLVSGTNAIVVNAGTGDNINLRGLAVNGLGTGLHGIRVLQAKSVKIYNTKVFGFTRNAIDFEPSGAVTVKGLVQNVDAYDNTGNGVVAAPSSTGTAPVTVRKSSIYQNGCGATATTFAMSGAFNFADNCGTAATFPGGPFGRGTINAYDSNFSENAFSGVYARGTQGTVRITRNEVTGNTNGLLSVDSGSIFSFGGNVVTQNGTNGAPTAPVFGTTKRAARR